MARGGFGQVSDERNLITMKLRISLSSRFSLLLLALAVLAFAIGSLTAQSTAPPANQNLTTNSASNQTPGTPAATPAQAAADAHQVPVMDGAIGTCTVDFTVTDNAQTPIYDAKIKVHIGYGFMYWRKLDLEQATNIDGKARFVGLPSRTKRGLFFTATQGDRTGTAFVDPSQTCNATETIVLEKKN